MKKIVFAIAILLILGSFTNTEWMQFRNIDGRFKVLIRGNLVEKMATIQTEIGMIESHQFVYQPAEKEENLAYIIMYYDFPKGGMHSDSTELLKEFFDTTVEEAATKLQGMLVYQHDLEHEGYAARQWRVNYSDNKVAIRSRAFMVKQRFYLLQTIGFTDIEQNNVSEYFINSFRLLGE
jgi:hypothetical protein